MTEDSDGNLYGTTLVGGQDGDGTVFELSGPGYSTYTVLASFTGNGGNEPGALPRSELTLEGNGSLYGTTELGGADDDGTVFDLSGANHTVFTSLVSLGNYSSERPFGALVLDSLGNLYGTATEGGSTDDGTVFELAGPAHTTFTILLTFTGTSGAYPGQSPAGLAIDSTGDLYGTTFEGGANNDGTVFELSGTSHSTFKTLVTFSGSSGSDLGSDAQAGLVFDGSGNLYGTTELGGLSGFGTVFELSGSNHQTFTSLVSFTGTTGTDPGEYPNGDLVFDDEGNLYDTTNAGGASGDGTVFKLSGTGLSTFSSLVTFTGANGNALGANSLDGLDFDATSGSLYGTSSAGGVYGFGSIFQIAISGSDSLVQNSGSLTVAAPAGGFGAGSEFFAGVTIGAGAGISLTSSVSGHTVLVTNGLSIAEASGNATGRLDIANNDLDIAGPTLVTITKQVAEGYDGGSWQGDGITSSSGANDSTDLTALGVIQNNQGGSPLYNSTNLFDGTIPGASDILVKYTYYGDANLDGKVDASDYSLIDNGYLNHLTGWYNGDFNYDGVVNGSDYTLIDNAYNMQGASLAAQIAALAPARASGSVSRTAVADFSQSQPATFFDGSPESGMASSIAAQIFGSDTADLIGRARFSGRRIAI